MQYAGQLAFGKVLQSASPAALNGILAVDPGKTVLTVDLSSPQWELGRGGGSAVPEIVGKQTLIDAAFGRAGTNACPIRAPACSGCGTPASPTKSSTGFPLRAANDNVPRNKRIAA